VIAMSEHEHDGDDQNDDEQVQLLVGSLHIPDGWLEGREIHGATLLYVMKTPEGAAMVSSVALDDSQLVGMTYPGGQRLVRLASEDGTDWSVEERFEGRQLDRRNDLDAPLLSMWANVVEGVTQTSRELRSEDQA
jgi:hypothetical protein